MRSAWLWILGIIVVWPMQFIVGWFADRPIKLALTDLLFILIPLAYLFSRFSPSSWKNNSATNTARGDRLTPFLALTCVIYAMCLGTIGFEMTGEVTRVLSAIRFVLPIGFVLLGLLLSATSLSPYDLIDASSRTHGIVVGLVLVSTLGNPNLRLGEWGKYLCGIEITGFPNAAMSYFAAMVPLLLASADAAEHRSIRLLGRGTAAGSTLMIVCSLSRSSAVLVFVGTAIYMGLTGRWKSLAANTAVFAVLSAVGLGLITIPTDRSVIQSRSEHFENQVEKRAERADPSNGRFEIWKFTLELTSERPVFGYLFEAFAHYAGDVEDPHQQYLEILYKIGIVGLALYLGLLVSSLILTTRLLMKATRGSRPWHYLCGVTGMLLAVLFGSLTQSNLGHSLTGNMVFLLIGALSHANAARLASDQQQSTDEANQKEPLRAIAA